MAQIDKIQVCLTTYDIAASTNTTNNFIFSDVVDGSAISWTTVSKLDSGKATTKHTHIASDLKDDNSNSLIITSQVSDNDHIPSSLLVKQMDDTLTSLNDASTCYVKNNIFLYGN